MKVKIKKIEKSAQIPRKAKEGDFCYDVYATSEREVSPNVWEYGIGLAFEIDRKLSGYQDIGVLQLKDRIHNKLLGGPAKLMLSSDNVSLSLDFRPRSSIWKTGMVLSNCEGTIDEMYRGEVKAYFYHIFPDMPRYKVGDRIGQIKLGFTLCMKFTESDELRMDTERGTGGFGSTGTD